MDVLRYAFIEEIIHICLLEDIESDGWHCFSFKFFYQDPPYKVQIPEERKDFCVYVVRHNCLGFPIWRIIHGCEFRFNIVGFVYETRNSGLLYISMRFAEILQEVDPDENIFREKSHQFLSFVTPLIRFVHHPHLMVMIKEVSPVEISVMDAIGDLKYNWNGTPTEVYRTKNISNIEQIDVKQTDVEQPYVEQTDVEQPYVEQTNVEQTDVEQPDVEQTDVEQTHVEQTRFQLIANLFYMVVDLCQLVQLSF